MDGSTHPVNKDILDRIAVVVGEKGLITDPAEIAPYVIDQRKYYEGRTPMVVRPATTNEVAEIVKICAESGTPIVPQGGNTGLCGGATPHDDGSAAAPAAGRRLCRGHAWPQAAPAKWHRCR